MNTEKKPKGKFVKVLEVLNSVKFHFYYPKYSGLVFIALFILISYFYSYQHILFLRPQGLHQWRQCDGLSITMNYYKENHSFFNPSVHSMESDEGKSGHTISEFPLIYYAIGNLWKITGHKEYLFRLTDILLVFIGLLAFFKICESILKDTFIALFCSFALFSSTVLAYYANNFIPNTSAFGLILVAWYCVYKYLQTSKVSYFISAFLFFLIGGLLKITQNLSLIALILTLLLNIIEKIYRRKKLSLKEISGLAAGVVILCLVAVYYYLAYQYNLRHHSGMFSFQLHPVWELTGRKINEIVKNFRTFWLPQYFSVGMHVFFIFSLFFPAIFFRHSGKFLNRMLLFLTAGSIVYVMFWFSALSNHDYYIIDLLITPSAVMLSFFVLLQKKFNQFYSHPAFRIVLLILLFLSIRSTSSNLKDRYHGWMNEQHIKHYQALENITPYLRELGIKREDVVLSIPDPSFNITLYLMDQRGFTSGGSNTDSFLMERMFRCGLKYLILNDSAMIFHPQIKPYIKAPMGQYKNILIYDLRNMSK